MKHLRICLGFTLTSLLLSLPVHAEQPFLWQIEGRVPSYLFGTIHSAHPVLNQLNPEVTQAFEQADAFFGELEFNQATIDSSRALFSLPPGDSLNNHLTAKQRHRVEQLLQRLNPSLNLAMFSGLKPWALVATLAMIEDQLRFSGQPVMDQRLYALALEQEKLTGGLETPEQQAQVFESLDSKEQQQLLDATLDFMEAALDKDGQVLDDTYAAYQSGDPSEFRDLMKEQMDVPLLLKFKLDRLLLTERNERMGERIKQLIEANPDTGFFFAVGAAHFSGGQALQYQLSRRNLKVKRVE